jgi:26S proteasome regulatory subunit N13
MMIPEDGHFVPYNDPRAGAKTNGRVFVLKFSSSGQRYLFWMQAKSLARNGDAGWFSPRDKKIGEIVDRLLQGDDVDVRSELGVVSHEDDRDEDNDEPMEDVEGTRRAHDHHSGGSGGAGPDATGGDVRQEGESSREGGADGARA